MPDNVRIKNALTVQKKLAQAFQFLMDYIPKHTFRAKMWNFVDSEIFKSSTVDIPLFVLFGVCNI